MRKHLSVLALLALLSAGCQTTPPYQSGGYLPQQYNPQQGPVVPAHGPGLGGRAVNAAGNLAGGFFRSAVGGAGFTAGRDLWNTIVN